MSTGKHGYSSRTVKRSELKKRKTQSDAQLLASAKKAAEKWQNELTKTKRSNSIYHSR